jgi:predicted esterase
VTLARTCSEDPAPGSSLYVLKGGRALLYPVYESTYERGDGLVSDYPDETANWKDHVIMWGKDLRRSIDCLETREDIDADRLAFEGVSWGAAMAPIMIAVEPRIKAGIVVVAGLNFQTSLPEVDELHYVTRVRVPMLVVNGTYDFFPRTRPRRCPTTSCSARRRNSRSSSCTRPATPSQPPTGPSNQSPGWTSTSAR